MRCTASVIIMRIICGNSAHDPAVRFERVARSAVAACRRCGAGGPFLLNRRDILSACCIPSKICAPRSAPIS